MQTEFCNGMIVIYIIWLTTVMIPKGDGRDLGGIGLIKVIWKTVTGILNPRFASKIQVHAVIHGFWEGHGMKTATLEAKLLKQIIDIREVVLYEIFLDPRSCTTPWIGTGV